VCVENQLIGVIIDFFIAGAETTSGSIGFALLYLLHNPDIQRQIQTELDQVCGDSLPQLAHRPRCDYIIELNCITTHLYVIFFCTSVCLIPKPL
jgi:cytochrome P450